MNFDHNYVECFWEELSKADNENYIITASSDNPEAND
jgi:hypothetical protein